MKEVLRDERLWRQHEVSILAGKAWPCFVSIVSSACRNGRCRKREIVRLLHRSLIEGDSGGMTNEGERFTSGLAYLEVSAAQRASHRADR